MSGCLKKAGAGRGNGRLLPNHHGRQRCPRGGCERSKKKTQEELDAEMEDYVPPWRWTMTPRWAWAFKEEDLGGARC